MAIETQCSCGRALTLRDELAGKIIRCPDCGGNHQVDDIVEVVEDDDADTMRPRVLPAHADHEDDLVPVVAVDSPPRSAPASLARVSAPDSEERHYAKPRRKRRRKRSHDNKHVGDVHDMLTNGLTAVFGGMVLLITFAGMLALGFVWIGGILLACGFVFAFVVALVNGSSD